MRMPFCHIHRVSHSHGEGFSKHLPWGGMGENPRATLGPRHRLCACMNAHRALPPTLLFTWSFSSEKHASYRPECSSAGSRCPGAETGTEISKLSLISTKLMKTVHKDLLELEMQISESLVRLFKMVSGKRGNRDPHPLRARSPS